MKNKIKDHFVWLQEFGYVRLSAIDAMWEYVSQNGRQICNILLTNGFILQGEYTGTNKDYSAINNDDFELIESAEDLSFALDGYHFRTYLQGSANTYK